MHGAADRLEQANALRTGNGIQYLLNAAAEILGNPLLMHDMEYKLIAVTEGVVTDDELWNELVTTGEHGKETQEFFRNEGLVDEVANAKEIAFLTSPRLRYSRIFGKIYNGDGMMVACLDAVGCNRSFEEDDPLVFDAVRRKLCHEIGQSARYLAYGLECQDALFKKLIDGDFGDKTLLAGYLANLYADLKDHLFLAVVESARVNPDYEHLAFLRDELRRARPAFKYAIYAGRVIIIVSQDDGRFVKEEDLDGLTAIFARENLRAGVSSRFENLYELRRYYREAVCALRSEAETTGRRVFLYDAWD